ncbi:MAG: branched-chain amino acid ABC transporter permease [Candidatus Rokubacteria bacterium]|nr:branched-chain amino acid ABC transporter permease [Candidatus Rokubacteria bacterium]
MRGTSLRPLWGWGLLALGLGGFPLLASEFYIRLATEILIMALFAMSFNLLLGYGGMLSFGHAGFYAVGAYTVAILMKKTSVPFFLAFPAAPAVTALVAAVTGYFCVRLRGFYFSILTLAFGQLIWGVIFKWSALTEGDDGIVGIRAPTFLTSSGGSYYFTLVLTAACIGLLWMIIESPFGRTLLAIRENTDRTQFIGVDVNRLRLLAFVLSATFAGVAGALFAPFNGSVFPTFALWTKSGEVVMMSILGGMHTFLGPAVGAAIMLSLDQMISVYTEYWPFVLGVILLVLVLFFPAGITGFVRVLARRESAGTRLA